MSIDIEETSRSRGVISTESPEPGYIVVSLTVLVPNPISAPSTSLSLASSPHFSHPYGICRYITTTVGAHRGADQGVYWSKDRDGIFICVRRQSSHWPDYSAWGNRPRSGLLGVH